MTLPTPRGGSKNTAVTCVGFVFLIASAKDGKKFRGGQTPLRLAQKEADKMLKFWFASFNAGTVIIGVAKQTACSKLRENR